jgi:hypothetical protein
MTKIACGNGIDAVRTGGIDAVPNALYAQLAQMSDAQLQRLLLWLDERGAATGRAFAVHQRDPSDTCSRELVELTLGKADAVRCRRRPRLPRLAELSTSDVQTVRAVLNKALAAYIGIWMSSLLAVGWLIRL